MFSYEDKKSAIGLYYNLWQEGHPTDQRARLSRQAHLCTIGSKTIRRQVPSQKAATARAATPKSGSALQRSTTSAMADGRPSRAASWATP